MTEGFRFDDAIKFDQIAESVGTSRKGPEHKHIVAEAFRVGDAIKFTQLAQSVWTSGWGPGHDHSQISTDFLALGAEVQALHENLKRLEHAIEREQLRARMRGAQADDLLGVDIRSLMEITGDYETTLEQCSKLLQVNALVSSLESPPKSEWDTSAQHLRDHLRRRHNSRFEHLIISLKRDLLHHFNDESIQHESSSNATETIAKVPDSLLHRFRHAMYRLSTRNVYSVAQLQDITDSFHFHLEKSNKELEASRASFSLSPTYSLELFKCQFLFNKAKDSFYLESLPRTSHWHGYVRVLGEALSRKLSRLILVIEGIGVDFTDCAEEAFEIWPETEQTSSQPPRVSATDNTDSIFHSPLLQLSLAVDSANMVWRMIKLFRDSNSDFSFRIVDMKGFPNQSSADEDMFDFNIRTATLVPLYAIPVAQGGEAVPLEIALKDENSPSLRSYRFLHMDDLLLFQRAITGFSVQYTEPAARAVFVRPSEGESLKANATVQIWTPYYLEDQPGSGIEDNRLKPGSVPPLRPSSSSRPGSIFSTTSVTPSVFTSYSTTTSIFSSYASSAMSSLTSNNSVYDEGPMARHGRKNPRMGLRESMKHRSPSIFGLRTRPRPRPLSPRLVLFIKDSNSQEYSIVSTTIDENTTIHPELCRCSFDALCQISCIMQARERILSFRDLSSILKWSPSTLNARRTPWNLLSLLRAGEWPGLSRISILFPSVEERSKFSGNPCSCDLQTEDGVDKCIKLGHEGILGSAKVLYRRQKLIMEAQNSDRQLDDILEQSSFSSLSMDPQPSAVQTEESHTGGEPSSTEVSGRDSLYIHGNDEKLGRREPPKTEDRELADEDLLQSDFELQKGYNGVQSYICTPPPAVTTDTVPLTVSGWPVVIPVEATYPLRALFVPLPDPHPKLIDPRLPLPNADIEEIFDLYDQALGIYLLIGGRLQIIVPDDFDYDCALSHKPRRFGGLEISYIQQTLTPCAGVVNVSDVRQQIETPASDLLRGESSRVGVTNDERGPASTDRIPLLSDANAPLRMTSGSVIQAVVSGSKPKHRFEGRVGVMTRYRDSKYITIPTHVVTSALISAKCPAFPGDSWAREATLIASNGGHQLGSIAETFDPNAGQFPAGFMHDVSLVEISHLPTDIVSGIKAPIPAAWASRTEWQEAKYSTTKLCLLNDANSQSHRAPVKTIGLLDSQCQAIGEGIFRLQQPRKGFFSAIRKSKEKEEGADVWTSLVARSLLFRVHPNCRPPGVQSGSAICMLQEDSTGTNVAKVAGFTAFAQETTAIQSFDTEGPRLYSRLEQGRVAFYGAFQIPSKLRDEHVIV